MCRIFKGFLFKRHDFLLCCHGNALHWKALRNMLVALTWVTKGYKRKLDYAERHFKQTISSIEQKELCYNNDNTHLEKCLKKGRTLLVCEYKRLLDDGII